MQVSMNECVSKNDVKTYLYLENVSHLSLNTLLTVTGWQISSKCFCHNNTKKVKKRGTNITLYQSHALMHVHVDKLSRGFTRWKTTHHSLKLHIILMPCFCFFFLSKASYMYAERKPYGRFGAKLCTIHLFPIMLL